MVLHVQSTTSEAYHLDLGDMLLTTWNDHIQSFMDNVITREYMKVNFPFSIRTWPGTLSQRMQLLDSSATLYKLNYRRVPKVEAPVTFGISRPKGPQFSSGRYFRVSKMSLIK